MGNTNFIVKNFIDGKWFIWSGSNISNSKTFLAAKYFHKLLHCEFVEKYKAAEF